ncbi:hypothetical protein [Mesorhizobium sp. Cs1299R1N3]|uniref:hypothetical protein n=1 Tax=Mesorhizobium sp. Cs1299R1N3 TaxID=3015173 RepID=UPI00301DA635
MTRYATIITGDDGLEVVSAIGEFEGAAPRARLGRVEAVAPGMVRDAVGGFCFPQAGIDSRAVGLVMARLKARANAAKPASAAKPSTARQKAAKRTRKKSARSRKPARRAKQALPEAAAGDTNAVVQIHD